MRHVAVAIALLSCSASAGFAQAPVSDRESFEVASVKRNTSGEVRGFTSVMPGGRFEGRNVSLRTLVRYAFQLPDHQVVGGPAWADSDRFDVAGTPAPAGVSGSQPASPRASQAMLRTLLRDRFKLATRTETRELPIYALRTARDDRRLGPQLRSSGPDCKEPAPPAIGVPAAGPPACAVSGGFGRLTGHGGSMLQLAAALVPHVGRPVSDETALPGRFDLDLRWTPDQLPPRAPGTPADQPLIVNGNAIDPNGPSIFTAVREQLGLTLASARGPVHVLVIDAAEPPAAD